MSHFSPTDDGFEVRLSDAERMFLSDVLPLLASVGVDPNDPAAERMRVPVYLDDPDSSDEWWRLMEADLDAGRHADRQIFRRVVSSEAPVTIDVEDADAIVRVLNEARLALGARLGIEVEADHDEVAEGSRAALDYLGWLQEELTTLLIAAL